MANHAPWDASVTVLEFAVTDRASPMVAATAGGGQAVHEERVPRGRRRPRRVLRPRGVCPGAIVETAAGHPSVEADYDEWPRGSTAEDLAAELDGTPPTLHGQLRAAERTLVSLVFAGDRPDRSEGLTATVRARTPASP